MHRRLGDLAVLIDRDFDVREGLMRLTPGGAWRPIGRALCGKTAFVGLEENLGLRPSKAEIAFAFEAILAERIRMDVIGRGCGPTLVLQSSEKSVRRVKVQSLQLSTEHAFNISVSEQDSPSIQTQVEVRLVVKPHWQGKDGLTEFAYAFSRSFPAPCAISTHTQGMPRRLTEELLDIGNTVSDEEENDDISREDAAPRNLAEYASQKADFSQSAGVPAEYDFRRDHSECLKPARGQGFCGSSYVLAALGAFEKQFCRHSPGHATKVQSAQWAFNCAIDSCGCDGGSVDKVHEALLYHGSVSEECLPYVSGQIHGPSGNPLGNDYCREALLSECGKARLYARNADAYELAGTSTQAGYGGWSAGMTQWLSGERAIIVAILSYGAVTSTMRVYTDLFSYTTGIYERTSKDFQGRSAVQLMGWGVEPKSGTSYWIGEHSWGPKWGENQRLEACSIQDCNIICN